MEAEKTSQQEPENPMPEPPRKRRLRPIFARTLAIFFATVATVRAITWLAKGIGAIGTIEAVLDAAGYGDAVAWFDNFVDSMVMPVIDFVALILSFSA